MSTIISADSVGVCIIEKNDFIREGLKIILGKDRYRVYAGVRAASDLALIKQNNRDKVSNCKVCLVGFGSGEKINRVESDIVTIKDCFPSVRIIVMSPILDEELVFFFSKNVDGYILSSISEKALIRSIDLVLLGEKIFPAAIVDMFFKKTPLSWEKNNRKLSEREIEVLECLSQGDSNKAIANKLSITDATVKVHLKAILRKLNVSNRTQAALWAANNMNAQALSKVADGSP
ncbi:MAG: LuxR C-terminal-related transcriptional regulator [Alphaproteobacteria bacterium]